MQDEAEVGLAGAMIDEVHAATFGFNRSARSVAQ